MRYGLLPNMINKLIIILIELWFKEHFHSPNAGSRQVNKLPLLFNLFVCPLYLRSFLKNLIKKFRETAI